MSNVERIRQRYRLALSYGLDRVAASVYANNLDDELEIEEVPLKSGHKRQVSILGMYGIGDCIHQRAVLRELMKTYDVHVRTYYLTMNHDLIEQGLKVHIIGNARIEEGDKEALAKLRKPKIIRGESRKLTYNAASIKRAGSILAAQFASCGLVMPDKPDFSLPVKPEWSGQGKALIASWNTTKPVMVYRPIIQNKTWPCPARSPDPKAYDAIYRSIRDRFFVVSVADLKLGREWIVGPEPEVDVKLNKGELNFEALTGLFSEADLVYANPGFTPVLAQAVGVPVIIVYGGNESFRTTNSVGAHLAPTLAIEPIKPCECHARVHGCKKNIDIPVAIERAQAFVNENVALWDHLRGQSGESCAGQALGGAAQQTES